CFKEALSQDYKDYMGRVVENAATLAAALQDRVFDIVSGGTDNHLMLVDLAKKGLTGKEVEAWLDEANITANKNTIPNDPQSPFVTSGIRLGTAAVTTRGMDVNDMDEIAEAIAMLINDFDANKDKAKAIVKKLTDSHPLY
ncbi:MAG: serine hydroxymethyltransferase, partial [Eubacterium sp.]|nr:serine hydroxymethyltransferase [Eubacterium sp.]